MSWSNEYFFWSDLFPGLDYSYCHEINIEDFSRVTFFTKLKNLKLEANGVEQQINMERLKCLEPMTWLEELNFIAEECVVDFKQLSKYTNLRRLLFNNSLKPNEKVRSGFLLHSRYIRRDNTYYICNINLLFLVTPCKNSSQSKTC